MNSATEAETDVESSVDLARDTVVVTTTETRTQTVEDLFDGTDGRLVLWEDGFGWSGLEYEDGEFYSCNYIRDGEDSRYLEREPVSEARVREKIEKHIEDPHAGGAGQFVARCSPP